MRDDKYVLRKERSLDMLNNGFEPVKNGFNEYFVPSQSDKSKKYKVTIKDKWYSCECPDNKEGNMCKHILFLKTYFALKFKSQEAKVSISKPCPSCTSTHIQKDGTRKTIMGKKQKWLCLNCNKRFVLDPVQKVKGNENTIITAIDLYMKGVSFRGIADSIKQFYGLKVTHVTVMNWINTYMEKINNYVNTLQPNVSDVWHADEQFIKAKGKQEYVWNVLDSDTRFLLASNEKPTRSYNDARETFQQAKAIAGKKAETVITDGAFSYEKAVRKEFATYKNPNPHYRYVSIRAKDSSNNKVERFHNTFRQRDKVMRGFGGNQKQQVENFRTYYNFIKEHQTLKSTPAQKAGIKQENNWKELLIKSVSN
jgi:transposase-like protein